MTDTFAGVLGNRLTPNIVDRPQAALGNGDACAAEPVDAAFLDRAAAPFGEHHLHVAKLAAMAVGVVTGWVAVLWVAGHAHADERLHQAALFVHLGSLVIGFGAVLAVDAVAALWLVGRRRLDQVIELVNALHVLIWVGLAGLMASGAFLAPDLSSARTTVKLGLVLVIGLNGVHAAALHHRLKTHADNSTAVSRRLLVRSLGSGALSQCGWWAATLIGFLNSQS